MSSDKAMSLFNPGTAESELSKFIVLSKKYSYIKPAESIFDLM